MTLTRPIFYSNWTSNLLKQFAGVLCAVTLTTALANTDYDGILTIAKVRYGDQAVATVQDWQDLINELTPLKNEAKLEAVNDFFNERVLFVDDIYNWKESDYWATPLETMGVLKGDCEDFTIAKYITLLLAGMPMEHLRLFYVKAKIGGTNSPISQAHMVLSYYEKSTSEPLILDNLIPDIKAASNRSDLTPVFSFNSAGIWVGTSTSAASNDPASKLSRWSDLIERMQKEGIQ
ncbi:hypothetical protein XMD579_001361 [Marinobacterium sp. xm-d-579]|nr:hypothetical protein [Marinobacterium sp. xm-d-579]